MFILPRYNDIFGYFTIISLYRESRYNDTSIKRSNSAAPLAYRYIGVPLYLVKRLIVTLRCIVNVTTSSFQHSLKV